MSAGRWRPSLRLRITAGALAVVVVALTVAGLLVVGVVEREMTGQIDTALRADADFTTRLLRSRSGLPTSEGPTDLYVQFVTADGRVVGAGTAALGRPALADPGAAPGEQVRAGTDPVLGDLRVLATPVPDNRQVFLVLARSSANVADVRQSLVQLLVLLGTVGSVLLGVVIWVVVGRALRPVDVMRRRVDELGEDDLQERLSRPGTGDELDGLADTLNDLLARLDHAVGRERQFVADASHELRTPIAGVRVLLETEPADPGEVLATRAEALARLGDLQGLVEQLLVLACADGLPAPRDEPVDLDDLVLIQADQLARTTGLHVDTAHVSGGQVRGSDVDLARVVENLATNAARYARTTVRFEVATTRNEVTLVVADDGPGIPPADRTRVFERFTSLDAARTSSRTGSGLGLSIVAGIVSSHGGRVEAGEADGGGARFVVHLPAAGSVPPERTFSGNRDTEPAMVVG